MTESNGLLVDYLETPIGTLAVIADAEGRLHATGWTDGHPRMHRALAIPLERASDPGGATSALRAYFAGDLDAIAELVVAPRGTAFQRAVWRALREIPCGETRTYGEVAQRIGQPTAVRAVGLANGANPVGVVVPCHRVIGADGTLTGYGGGLERKRWLLAHESAALDRRWWGGQRASSTACASGPSIRIS